MPGRVLSLHFVSLAWFTISLMLFLLAEGIAIIISSTLYFTVYVKTSLVLPTIFTPFTLRPILDLSSSKIATGVMLD